MIRHPLWMNLALYIGQAMAAQACAQTAAPIPHGRVAWIVESAVTKGGDRFRQTGQQRWSGNVQVTGPKGEVTINGLSLVMQWPGKLAIKGSAANVAFAPGVAKHLNLAQSLSDTAEIFLEDTLDGFLAQHLGGASTRIIGTAYPDPARPGSSCNVVVLRFVSQVLNDSASHSKEYWFDTKTKELVRVVHDSGREVLLRDYVQLGGNEFVGTLRVLDNGVLKYTITLAPSSVGPALDDSTFGGND